MEIVTLEEFGAIGDGIQNDTAAWEAANDDLVSKGGGIILGEIGKQYCLRPTTIASNVTFKGGGPGLTTLCAHASTPKNRDWLLNRDWDATSRICERPSIRDCTLDGSNIPYARWLSQADGTPITNPEADYVPGSGALASGISGVSLSAQISGGSVVGVSVNNGGSGWNSHPTHPYLPETVALIFNGGGGAGAVAFARISGGTLSSVTVVEGGAGYTSEPTVTTMGGYADISLLVESSVDRRNPNYVNTGSGLVFRRAISPFVENVEFKNFRGRALSDAGSLNSVHKNLKFENCGKSDGAFPCILVIVSRITDQNGQETTVDSENCLLQDIVAENCERSAVLWSPSKGGTIRGLRARNCGESTIFVSDKVHESGGSSLFENLDLSDNILTDIAGQLIELGDVENFMIRNSRFKGAALEALNIAGTQNTVVRNCVFENNGTARSTLPGRKPYGPFSERFAFSAGEMPTCGEEITVETLDGIKIGTQQDTGNINLHILQNSFSERRENHPKSIFTQTRSGTQSENIAKSVIIDKNDISQIPNSIEFLDTSRHDVFATDYPIQISENYGHASQQPLILNHNFTSTGDADFEIGFRPRYVEVLAEVQSRLRFRACHSRFLWKPHGENDPSQNKVESTMHSFSTSSDEEYAQIFDTEILRVFNPITNSSGGNDLLCRLKMSSWNEIGFTINCDILNENTRVRFICHS